jgi:rod shape-determining protein MreC
VFRIHKKKVMSVVAWAFCIGCAFFIIPRARLILPVILKQPLRVLTFIQREIGSVVFFHRNFLLSERLGKEAGILRSQLIAQEELRLENERLRKLLGFTNESAYRVIAARVIGRSADSWSSTIILDRGSRAGVRGGMAVMTDAGFLGRVMDVTLVSAKVLLISDPGMGISGIVQRSRQEGLVSGTLGTSLVMRYLPEAPDIQAGDVVVTSGLNQVYPKGLLLGTVTNVVKDAGGISTHAVLAPAVNMSGLEEVLIIAP